MDGVWNLSAGCEPLHLHAVGESFTLGITLQKKRIYPLIITTLAAHMKQYMRNPFVKIYLIHKTLRL